MNPANVSPYACSRREGNANRLNPFVPFLELSEAFGASIPLEVKNAKKLPMNRMKEEPRI